MLDYMANSGAVDEARRDELSEEAAQIMADIVETHGQSLRHEFPSVRFLRTLTGLLESEKAHAHPYKGKIPEHPKGEHVGWQDDNFLYLFPSVTYNLVANFLAQRGESLGAGERVLWKQLDEAGLIQTEVGTDGQVQRLPKKALPYRTDRSRVLHLRKASVRAALDKFE